MQLGYSRKPARDAPADAQAGLVLVASVDDSQIQEVGELKQQIRQVVKRITPSSEPRASIESGKYSMQSVALPPASQTRGAGAAY